ncbi:MAG TPA: YitT family protein [Firmicutes bacterium]|nr:YitT family protein [Bacillota bacterium]
MMGIAKNRTMEMVLDLLVIIAGTALFALGVHVFTVPNHIAPGGLTGIATLISYLTKFPIGTVTMILNIPIMVAGFLSLGRRFIFNTFVSVVSFTLFSDILFAKIPVYQGDMILAAIFGGVVIGSGLALAFLRGGSTGGTDIINRIVQKKIPHIKLGKITFLTDLMVILAAMAVYRDFEAALYAVVSIFVQTTVMDKVLYGMDVSKMALIITEQPEKVSQALLQKLQRGCTILKGTGAYTGEEKSILVCAVHRNQFYKVKQVAAEADPGVFMILSDASEVMGHGFKSMQ